MHIYASHVRCKCQMWQDLRALVSWARCGHHMKRPSLLNMHFKGATDSAEMCYAFLLVNLCKSKNNPALGTPESGLSASIFELPKPETVTIVSQKLSTYSWWLLHFCQFVTRCWWHIARSRPTLDNCIIQIFRQFRFRIWYRYWQLRDEELSVWIPRHWIRALSKKSLASKSQVCESDIKAQCPSITVIIPYTRSRCDTCYCLLSWFSRDCVAYILRYFSIILVVLCLLCVCVLYFWCISCVK